MDVQALIIKCVVDILELEGGVEPNDNFFALGGDSLAAIAIMDEVENALCIEFPLELLLENGALLEVILECSERHARRS